MDNFETAKTILRRFGLRRTAWESLQELGQKYGIEIAQEWRLKEGSVSNNKINLYHLQPAFEVLDKELKIYSTSMMKATKLRRIMLCAQVRANGSRAGGVFMGNSGTLYLPINWFTSSLYSRFTFHHELYHCIDYNDSFWKYFDLGWSQLNEKGFSYSSQAHSEVRHELPPRLGFVSRYAMNEVWEDKAELYATMILHYKSVAEQCERDPILKKKFLRIKETLQKFCIEFNESFWKWREQCSIPLWNDDFEVITLRIWEEAVEGKQIWLVQRKNAAQSKPVALYSKPRLDAFLSKFGIKEFREMEKLYSGSRKVEVTLRALRTELDNWRL